MTITSSKIRSVPTATSATASDVTFIALPNIKVTRTRRSTVVPSDKVSCWSMELVGAVAGAFAAVIAGYAAMILPVIAVSASALYAARGGR